MRLQAKWIFKSGMNIPDFVCLVCGYIPAGLGVSPLLSFTMAITVMVIVFLILPRLTKNNTLP